MYTMKSILLLLLPIFSFGFARGQNNDAIRFIYRYLPERPHPTFAICVGKLVQPFDAGMIDSLHGGAILTDSNTYRWIREYILSSFYTYSAKDAAKANNVSEPMCPILSPVIEMKDSGGMDMFVCFKDWRPFFDTLRAKLQQNLMDTIVINVLKKAPAWPRTLIPTKYAVHIK